MSTKMRRGFGFTLSLGAMALLALHFTSATAWAGPGSTGGGLSDASGSLLDFGETDNPNTVPFNPVKSEAFQKVLLPILNKLNSKVPGAASDLLVGLPPNMEWWLSDLPIANSSDECNIFKEDSLQIAKQVDGELGISRQWMNSHSLEQQAGLTLHELILFRLDKAPNDCATRVRRAVRYIFNVDNLSEDQLQSELSRIGIQRNTKTQVDHILSLSKDLIHSYCDKPAPQPTPSPIPTSEMPGGWSIPSESSGMPAWSGSSSNAPKDPRVAELAQIVEPMSRYSTALNTLSTILSLPLNGDMNAIGRFDVYSCPQFKQAVDDYSHEGQMPTFN